jgi:uncharacterized repeat protein (TIGR02543 family)
MPNYFKVTYFGNNNTDGTIPVDTNLYPVGSEVTVKDNTGLLEKPNYSFNGWTVTANKQITIYNPGDVFIILRNTTLNARWTTNYTVLYNGNENTMGYVPNDNDSYTTGSLVTVKNAESLQKIGYNFGGWNTNSNGTGTQYSPNDVFNIVKNTILYAQWIKGNISITYNGNNNINGIVPVDTKTYPTGSPVIIENNTGYLVKPNYTFGGWNTSINGVGKTYYPREEVNMFENTTLFAKWLPNVVESQPKITMGSLYSNNAQVFYKSHTLAPGGIGGVRNFRLKSRKT